jgi:hypothetical protein
MKRNPTLLTCTAIVLLAGSFGCSDEALELTKPTSRSQVSAAADPSVTSERAALTTLTRAVALALANDAFRAEALQQMRSAPFKEHKLELRQYLNPGRLARLSSASGKTASELASALQIVRALEFYMPIASQRESWTGDANILVASQLDDGDEIVAFDLKGRQVALTEASPPSVPTLTIVGLETRFNEPVDPKKSQNINDRSGKAIGTMVRCAENPAACSPGGGNNELKIGNVIECGDCSGGGTVSGTYGLFMSFSRLVDMGEPWTKGDPEIEVHVHGPPSETNPQYGADLSCSGEHALPERQFDQNNAFWNGSVLILTQAEINAYNARSPGGYNILFWEDDNGRCSLRFDNDVLTGALTSIAGALGGAAVRAKTGWSGVGIGVFLATFLASLYENSGWLLGNDDFLGALVPASTRGDSWSDANLTLLKQANVVNGRANMIGK